jgi:diaminopimelate decarboxylase
VTLLANPGFLRDGSGALSCDGLPLADLAASVGTPTYVYSAAVIRRAWQELDAAFASVPHALHYALKANSTLGILRLLRSLGSRADANSGGEIEVALRAGFIPDDIVFTGVGKTPDELRRAIALGVKAINVESPGELERIDAFARQQGTRARVAVRVNPDIEAGTHPHISTGRRTNKFGVPVDVARDLYRQMVRLTGIEPVGVHIHIGSQITDLGPLTEAARAVVALTRELRAEGIALEHLDLGGGLGISYDGKPVPGPADYAERLIPVVRESGLQVLLEPGRILVGSSAVLLSRVVDEKEFPGGKRFVVLDAGMTELIRPALYGAYHRVEPVQVRGGEAEVCDLVGPLCESSDTVAKDRTLSPLHVGDLVAIFDAGAYGSAMSFTYNRRPLPCEVLVEEGTFRIIRRRQTIDDMTATEA